MENLNAEHIANVLEVEIGFSDGKFTKIEVSVLKDALALINSQEQRIKELAEEAQTYKKHHDIMDVECSRLEKRNDELTEEIESLKQAMEHEHASFMETFGEYGEKCERLAEENERLRERNITLEQKLMLLGIDDVYVFKEKVKGE